MLLKPQGVFIYVDDDQEEHDLFKMALSEICENQVVSAYDGDEAFELIEKHKDITFLVISDITMPRVTGFELKRMIENSAVLKLKAIPFIFHSALEDPVIIKEAYSLNIQGYMIKQTDLKTTIRNLEHFIRFWTATAHPHYYMNDMRL